MDRFPQEIVSVILDYLNTGKRKRSHLLRYVTISRQWQYAVERLNLNGLEFESTETDLAMFADLFRPSQSHRSTLVKDVVYNIVLPKYSDAACGKVETESDKESNNRVFAEAICNLFKILKSLDNEEVRRAGGLMLDIQAYSPMDTHRRPNSEKKRNDTRRGKRKDLWTKRYWASFLQLKDHDSIPVLSNVSIFYTRASYHSRNVEPASAIAIMSKLKGLKTCDMSFSDREVIGREVRQMNRNNFAQSLSTFPNSIDSIALELGAKDSFDESTTPQNLLPPSSSATVDPLNPALHTFINRANLKSITIQEHLVTPDLFWPSSSPSPTAPPTTPIWQNLRSIEVHMQLSTVDGGWYFMPDTRIVRPEDTTNNPASAADDEEYDSDTSTESYQDSLSDPADINTFRRIPDPARMNPLLIAMARAARHAPVLERMWLTVPGGEMEPKYPRRGGGREGKRRRFEIMYLARRVRDDVYGGDGGGGEQGEGETEGKGERETERDRPRLICQVDEWRADGEVQGEWARVLAPDGIVLYNTDDY
ncbi:hypothetical protein AJ79_07883 [Helicocarpus griseus UAMH5409]|uniref:F-box domain-containing protein n=1 Tax=Helicocarpus griseus UAMH5409 TaxID=1447875 RepID=A0A2B7WXL9_9EURO|nr:hypothetical protein AJ79_07883 [Helicocarpus griseus UAMH5409]